MSMYLSDFEKKISEQFEKKGYCILKVEDIKKLNYIKKLFINLLNKHLNKENKGIPDSEKLNFFHKLINKNQLNDIRLDIIKSANKDSLLKLNYYHLSKKYLDILVGNELAMQSNINLSIQLPRDNSSLLPVHSDVWSGDSPYEIVSWIPLVDCQKTKSMYILPPSKYRNFQKKINRLPKFKRSADQIFKSIKKDLIWIKISFGEILIFNQCLPHGNVINLEPETRWSLNCRFKSLLTPFSEKKLGEFFQPITLRKITELGMKYQLPKFDE